MKRTHIVAALLSLLAGAMALLAPPVSAQTAGYPPGPCTVLTGTVDVGTVTVGQRFVLQLAPTCPFTVGASVEVVVNGVNIPGKVANANGAVTVTITAVSTTQLLIEDPVLTPAFCGVNTVTATGPSAVVGPGATVRQTALFTLLCPVASVAAVQGNGRLALTGANLLRWIATALLLSSLGWMIVLADRRRHRAREVRP